MALQLAAVGVPKVLIVDHDVVETVNLAPQGYYPCDVGHPKVDCTRNAMSLVNHATEVLPFRQKFSQRVLDSLDRPPAVFCCVDSISARKFVWESVKDYAAFYCDARVAAESVQIFTAPDPRRDTEYDATLFDQRDAYAGSCTAKMTVFQANVAAGLMLQQWSKWLRGMYVEPCVVLNLLSMEMCHAVP